MGTLCTDELLEAVEDGGETRVASELKRGCSVRWWGEIGGVNVLVTDLIISGDESVLLRLLLRGCCACGRGCVFCGGCSSEVLWDRCFKYWLLLRNSSVTRDWRHITYTYWHLPTKIDRKFGFKNSATLGISRQNTFVEYLTAKKIVKFPQVEQNKLRILNFPHNFENVQRITYSAIFNKSKN